ncbi:MAG: HAD family hydrolase [Methanospirillum sp.]|nr:HAD family hydrolase [Methanospirillum sp.]
MLFDIDNTFWDLIEAKQAGCRAVADWLGRGDGDELFGYFCRPVLDFEHPGHLRDFLADHGCRDPALHEEGLGRYRSALLDALEVYPGVAETLSHVRGLGLRTGIVTDAYDRDARDRLEVAGLDGLFDCVVAFETTRQRKPAPAPFRVALAALGVRPGEAVYVGDSLERDIGPAQRMGMVAVHAAYGDRNIGPQPDVTPDATIDGIAVLLEVLGEQPGHGPFPGHPERHCIDHENGITRNTDP